MRSARPLILFTLTVTAAALTAALFAGEPETAPPPSPAATPAAGDAPPVEEIVRRTNLVAYYQGRDGRAQVAMTIRDAQGRERSRQFTILRRDVPVEGGEADEDRAGDQQLYVYFHRPADVNRTAYLVWKHAAADQDDDRWLYDPGLDLILRIAAGDKRTSFVGSDFYYEDVSGRRPDADEHVLAETTDDFYVLDNTPLDPDSVEFSRFRMYVHRESFIPVSIEYYNRQGVLYRRYTATGVESVQGYPTVTSAQMEDLEPGAEPEIVRSTTTLQYTDVSYDLDLPAEIFAEPERSLRQPPRRHLR